MRWILKMKDGSVEVRKKLAKLFWFVEETYPDKYIIQLSIITKKLYKTEFKLIDEEGNTAGTIYNNQWKN